jgi:hypothetical protein
MMTTWLSRSRAHRTRRTLLRAVCLTALVVVCSTELVATSAGSATSPGVVVSGTNHGWVFHDGQTVSVSMGPNKRFVPGSRVNILECSDQVGTKKKLPTRFVQCDENTIQGDTVIVNKGGSFKETAYQLFSLPNSTFGEQSDWQPVCNRTHACVLMISEYQTDFTKPKVFSHSFIVTPSSTEGAS